MASATTHVCAITLRMENGHDKCIVHLGFQHAEAARENPAACMNCFIMPRRTREARAHFFAGKRTHSHSNNDEAAKCQRLQSPNREGVSASGVFRSGDRWGWEHTDSRARKPRAGDQPRSWDQLRVASAASGPPATRGVALSCNSLGYHAARGPTPLYLPLRGEGGTAASVGEGAPPARLWGCGSGAVLCAYTARWSSVSRRLANVSEAGRIGCERPPPIDHSLAALVSPAGSA